MKADEEGFLYPKTDRERCTDCGLCERVCPFINPLTGSEPKAVFAAKNNDLDSRRRSSSGGLFIALAQQCIADGGVVFGAVFDDEWEVHHVRADNIASVLPMMRSKYVQSRTEDTFSEARALLRQGRKVLFTGTSCQIAGLKRFLRRDYDNLLAVDVICHGVPSPMVWRHYLNEIADKAGSSEMAKQQNSTASTASKPLYKVADVCFREKCRSGFEWEKYGFRITFESSDEYGKNTVEHLSAFNDNPYMQCFLQNLCLRPSCYACKAKASTSHSDLTIADFWGVRSVLPTYHDCHGVGLAVAHSEKGRQALLRCDVSVQETTICEATAANPSYYYSVAMPTSRDRFFRLVASGTSVEEATRDCLYREFVARLRHNPIAMAKHLIKKCLPATVVQAIKKAR